MGGMKNFYVVLGVLTVGGVAVLMFARSGASMPVSAIPAGAIDAERDWPGYVLGSPDAPVEIIEYADFECNACQYWWLMTVKDVKERLVNSGQVRYVFRDFPLEMHPKARFAHHAAACASEQGLFEPMHDQLFGNQRAWAQASGSGENLFREYAETAGVDIADYNACMSEGRYRGRIQASLEAGMELGVGSTPTFQIGGSLYQGLTFQEVKVVVDSLIAESGQ
jgi:protein-disulfide isomerase